MKNKPLRIPLPLTFFEKAKQAILQVSPDFFDSPLDAIAMRDRIYKYDEELAAKYMPMGRKKARGCVDFPRKFMDLWTDLGETEDEEVSSYMAEHKKGTPGYENATDVGFTWNYILHLIEMIYWIQHDGRKMFRVEEGLFSELLITDANKVDGTFFKLPFKSMCIHIPHNRKITMRGHVLEWIHINESQESDCRVFRIITVARNGRLYGCSFVLADGSSVCPDCGEQHSMYIMSQIKEQGVPVDDDTFILYKFIVSLVLYLNTKEVDAQEILPQGVIKSGGTSKLPVCVLGRNIKVDRRIILLSKGNSKSTNLIQILKWTVRGHFRNQAHGNGRLERKIIQIRPYIKGRERANDNLEAKNSIYQLT